MNTKIAVSAFAFLVFLTAHVADAQQAIFLVRHAKDVRSTDVVDRPLTEAGHGRAMLLASLLKDAGIGAIFTSSLQRTIKTAEPLATALKIEPKTLPQLTTKFNTSDMESFVELLRSRHRDDIVLFVGHANTVPALLKAFGHQAEIKIPETENGNVFVVFPRSGVPPTVLRLRFNQTNCK
jgi:phosphohistidine phosphatase SixA